MKTKFLTTKPNANLLDWKVIFNPFSKFTELQLFILGFLFTIIGSYIGTRFGIIFDGVFDVHIHETTFWESLQFNFINIISVVVFLTILGKILNPKTRIIDIVNTATIARIPLYLLGLITNNEKLNSISNKLIEGINNPNKISVTNGELFLLSAFSFISLLVLAYVITLLVNGFKTAINIKKWQHYVLLGLVLILAEIFSKFLLTQL